MKPKQGAQMDRNIHPDQSISNELSQSYLKVAVVLTNAIRVRCAGLKSQSLYPGAWLKKHGDFASENAKAFEKMKRGEQFREIMVGV